MTIAHQLTGSAPRLAGFGAIQVTATLVAGSDTSLALAGHVRVDVEVLTTSLSSLGGGTVIEVDLVDAHGTTVAAGRSVAPPATERPAPASLVLDVDGVRPWWPRSLGDPHRYDVRVRLLVDDVEVDRHHQRVGFRSIELDTSPDTLGAAFTFVVNGTPLFTRGVTWWGGASLDDPPDDAPDDASDRDAEPSVQRLLAWIRDTDVDLVRVRGGDADPAAIDLLLDACDDLGVLVWFDLPSHTLVHDRRLAAREVVARARADVLHLRHHPCLAIWCGDDWGAAEALWSDDVPLVLEELDPDRPYWPGVPPTSPWPGAGGDLHGCGQVWEPVDVRDRACRFVAAFGLSPRSGRTVPELFDPGIIVDSPAPRRCDGEIAAAHRVRAGIEHFRSMRGHCMGVVWSPADVAEARGPVGQAAREAFADRLLTVQPRGRRLVLHVVNDARTTWWATGTATRTTFDGTVRIGQPFDVVVPPRSVVRVELDPCVAWARDPGGEVLAVEAGDAHTWWWFADDHELRLPEPRLAGDLVSSGDGRHVLTLTSTTVVRDLVVDPARLGPGASVDRPVVTMQPGRTERFLIEAPSGTWPAHLHVDGLVERSVIRWAAAPRAGG